MSDPVERQRLALHSVIPAMKMDALIVLLGTVLAPDKADKILDLLVLDETRELVDMQYTPFPWSPQAISTPSTPSTR